MTAILYFPDISNREPNVSERQIDWETELECKSLHTWYRQLPGGNGGNLFHHTEEKSVTEKNGCFMYSVNILWVCEIYHGDFCKYWFTANFLPASHFFAKCLLWGFNMWPVTFFKLLTTVLEQQWIWHTQINVNKLQD